MMVLFFIMMAQMVIMTMPRALECCSRVQNVLDHSPEIVDYVNTDPQIDEKNNQVLAFDHVTFRFADAEEDTLSDLNFTCRRAQTTAIIGGTIDRRLADPALSRCQQRQHPPERHRYPRHDAAQAA